tara:strand:+ start:1546 stop:2430 length:885 start_codon:yes stop_codon:yes gene_type:complete
MPSKTKRKSPTGSRPKTKSASQTPSRTRSRTTLSPMSSTPSIQKLSREEYLDGEIKKYKRRIRECNKAITAKGTILQRGLYPIPASQFRNIVGNIAAEESSPGYQQHLHNEMLRNDRQREAERRVERYYDNVGAYEAPGRRGNTLSHYRGSGGKSHTPGRNKDDIVIGENIQKKISILADLKEKYKKCRLEHQRIKNHISYVGSESQGTRPVVVASQPVFQGIMPRGVPMGYIADPYLAVVSVPPTSQGGPTMLEELTQLAEMEEPDQQGPPMRIQPRRGTHPHSPLPGGFGRF